jgi:hypothetical protein
MSPFATSTDCMKVLSFVLFSLAIADVALKLRLRQLSVALFAKQLE